MAIGLCAYPCVHVCVHACTHTHPPVATALQQVVVQPHGKVAGPAHPQALVRAELEVVVRRGHHRLPATRPPLLLLLLLAWPLPVVDIVVGVQREHKRLPGAVEAWADVPGLHTVGAKHMATWGGEGLCVWDGVGAGWV